MGHDLDVFLDFKELKMGYAGAISSDGRVAFVLNGKSEYIKSQIRTAKNKAGLKLNINEDEACKSMAKYLVDNFGFTKELKSISKFNASHHVPKIHLSNGKDIKEDCLFGFAIVPKIGSPNKIEAIFISGQVNGMGGRGLRDVLSNLGPTSDLPAAILHRTFQKKTVQYLENLDELNGYEIGLKAGFADELW